MIAIDRHRHRDIFVDGACSDVAGEALVHGPGYLRVVLAFSNTIEFVDKVWRKGLRLENAPTYDALQNRFILQRGEDRPDDWSTHALDNKRRKEVGSFQTREIIISVEGDHLSHPASQHGRRSQRERSAHGLAS